MKSLLRITFALLILAFSSCQKNLNARFKCDKSDYMAGEKVHLKNLSTGAYSYMWTLPNGTKCFTKDCDFVLDSTITTKIVTFQLRSYSITKKHFKDFKVNVNLKGFGGSLIFWTKSLSGLIVDFNHVSMAPYFSQTEPDCNSSLDPYLLSDIPPGIYSYNWYSNSCGAVNTYTFVTIKKGICTKVELF